MTRWRNCSRPRARQRASRNSGWPSRRICSKRPPADLEVGEHAQLFERRCGRFCASSTISSVRARRAPRRAAPLDRVEQLRLAQPCGGDAEPLRDEAEHVVALDLGRDEADRVQPRRGRSSPANAPTSVDLPAPISPVTTMNPRPGPGHSRDRPSPSCACGCRTRSAHRASAGRGVRSGRNGRRAHHRPQN